MATPVWSDIVVPAGTTRSYTQNTDYGVASALMIGGDGTDIASTPPHVINYGEIDLVAPAESWTDQSLFFFVGQVGDWSSAPIENYGTISAILPENWGAGLIGGDSWMPDLHNSGTLIAEARYYTTIYGTSDQTVVTNTATGVISVSSGVNPIALDFSNGAGTVVNDGQILVHLTSDTLEGNPRWPVAIYEGYGAGAGVYVTNTGLIQATDEEPNTDLSIAIFLNGDGGGSIVNSGTISGDWAIRELGNGNESGSAVEVDNSGTVEGHVWLNAGDDVISNSGEIIGDVRLGLGNDSYDGALGSVSGAVSGEGGNDRLTGGSGNEQLSGGDGDDTLEGGGGDDLIDGGSGFDYASYSHASEGVSVHLGSGEQNTNGAGADTLISIEALIGSAFADTLTGDSFGNTLIGGAGRDILDGGAGNDRMIGGTGNDIYYVDSTNDQVIENAGEGTDWVFSSANYTLADNIEVLTLTGSGNIYGYGNARANDLWGNAGNNVLLGLGGNDTLDGGAGADRMYGGVGDDRYYVDNSGDQVFENSGEGTDRVYSSINIALPANVEQLFLTGSANINALGSGIDNVIVGNSGDNSLDGALGADRMYGGLGDDRYYVDNAGDQAIENSGEGTDRVYSSINIALPANVEQLFLTGSANLNALGSGIDNVIVGNSGDNIINGALGADRMYGGLGDDRYYVDNSGDQVFENSGEGTDRVYSSVSLALPANVEQLFLTGSTDINALGSGIDNVIVGNSGDNIINGALGADRMYGGLGDDRYFVDNAGDQVFENAGEGTDRVYSSISLGLSANVEQLFLTGSASIAATGNSLDNVLVGNSGANSIDGGAGADRMYGEGGADTFVFDDGDFGGLTASANDRIGDFSNGEGDRIDLSRVDADSLSAGDQHFTFIGNDGFHDVAGELRYDIVNGNTYVYGDTNGDGLADLMIQLDGTHALTSGDFIVG